MKEPLAVTPIAKMISLLLRGVAPTAAVASGLVSPPALSAPGDFDPTFADVGRLGPVMDFAGQAWSVQSLDNDESLIAGGDFIQHCRDSFYCYYSSDLDASSFLSKVSATGSFDSSFAAAQLPHTQVFDVAPQPDGNLIAVGQSIVQNLQKLTVFRLTREGALDTTFGSGGIFLLKDTPETVHKGTSVALDTQGRIVVAGLRADPAELIVLRLLANGVLDTSFGTSGIYTGPSSAFLDSVTHILLTGTGGYRVTTSECGVVALTADGALDKTFGTAGIAPVKGPSGASVACNSMVAQPDGRLLVAGNAGGTKGFAARLLASGAPDVSFAADIVATTMDDATALAVSGDGSIVVAGRGPTGVAGAVIMRLQANGVLDTLFGNAGLTQIDLPSDVGTSPRVHDMYVRPDGGVVATGGDDNSNHPFVIRLLGAGSADAAGVLGVSAQSLISVKEKAGEVIVNVRRTGGHAGSVSVAYSTVASGSNPATVGQDFTKVEGRLTWNDGDTTEQQVHVPVLDNATPEDPETFNVVLSDAQGGAGLGTRNATVEIAADGDPSGQFEIGVNSPNVMEGDVAQVLVTRNYYTTGAVSVTVTPVGATATAGGDFAPEPVTLSWADGEGGTKVVAIAIRADALQELSETFTVKLSNPTGGAILGPRSSTAMTISASSASPSGGGGGGSLGYFSLLILGVAGFLQLAWKSVWMGNRRSR